MDTIDLIIRRVEEMDEGERLGFIQDLLCKFPEDILDDILYRMENDQDIVSGE